MQDTASIKKGIFYNILFPLVLPKKQVLLYFQKFVYFGTRSSTQQGNHWSYPSGACCILLQYQEQRTELLITQDDKHFKEYCNRGYFFWPVYFCTGLQQLWHRQLLCNSVPTLVDRKEPPCKSFGATPWPPKASTTEPTLFSQNQVTPSFPGTRSPKPPTSWAPRVQIVGINFWSPRSSGLQGQVKSNSKKHLFSR